MKKKDIIVLALCIMVILACVFIMFKGFSKSKSPSTSTQRTEKIDFTGNIDEKEIKKLKERKDYGVPSMENIGRENPFANL